MWLILAALLAGVFIGACGLLPAGGHKRLDRVMAVTLYVMLVALGAQIGGNQELLANLGLLGGRAVVISAFSIIGSIVALWLATRYCLLYKGDDA
jgi:uncharacterized membrane protein YbjE (DUF340 family)